MATMIYSVAIFVTCLCFTTGSYMGYPRINFGGFFRADAGTRNNDKCNYHENYRPWDPRIDFNADWGFNGTNEFEWYNNVVTSVFRQDGMESTDDPIIGKYVTSNLKRPYAKLVDLDVDCQFRSTIYGMKFGIANSLDHPEDNLEFFGNWTRSIVAQDMWSRIACYSPDNTGGEIYQDSFPFGASGTTVITNIQWKDTSDSPALQELKTAALAVGNKLQVRVALTYYTRNLPSYIPYNATLGYLTGTIGIPSPTQDTLNVPGQRTLRSIEDAVPQNMDFVDGDLCYQQDHTQQTWVSTIPFEVDSVASTLTADFSGAFTVDLSNTLMDIGTISLAVALTDQVCILPLENGIIPYLTSPELFTKYSGIYTIDLNSDEKNYLTDGNNFAQIVQIYNNDGGSSNICGDFLSTGVTDTAYVLGQEPEYFVRPIGYYVDRLTTGDTSTMTFKVTKYGNLVSSGVWIHLSDISGALPTGAIVLDNDIKEVTNGRVSFTFTATNAPPAIREYSPDSEGNGPCPLYDPADFTLPIDGNVYFFGHFVCTTDSTDSCIPLFTDPLGYLPTFLYFSDVTPKDPSTVNWVDDVGPILSQYAKVSPVMNYILDMSSYNQVILTHNRELMKLAFNREFSDPGYMPTTRDLSPGRRQMIIDWLNQDGTPLYDANGGSPPPDNNMCNPPTPSMLTTSSSCVYNPRCETPISYNQHPAMLEPYYRSLSDPQNPVIRSRLQKRVKGRPLMGILDNIKQKREGKSTASDTNVCITGGVEALREQLQTAIEVEFATIPVYLTALYSIIDGCNQEIYDRIREVAMQEMIHMAQAANILIAIGGDPVIDKPTFIPQYPTNLPGDILPGLTVSLKKVTLDHMKDVLMGIEVPVETQVGDPPVEMPPGTLTIGALYGEVKECIMILDEGIFSNPRLDRQVEWPWVPESDFGTVTKVSSVQNAVDAIDMIVAQGEGTSELDPSTLEDNLSHFYKFEEIVCQNELELDIDTQTYSYIGTEVPFNAAGIWNMRDNPSAADIQPNTNCYTEAKAFHIILRRLLKSLDEVFNGLPERVNDAVILMESLQVHAKKTMWTKFKPNSYYTCGPVWDYYWPGEEPTAAK